MLYLVISIVGMTMVACLFKQGMLKGASPLGFNSVYRATAAILCLCVACARLSWAELPSLFADVGLLGFVAAVFLWITGIASLKVSQLGPLGVGWTVIRCSMLLPTLASLLYWREVTPETPALFAARLGGMAAIVLAIVCFGLGHGRTLRGHPHHAQSARSWYAWLTVAFCAQGAWEICLRVTRQSLHHDQARLFFIVLVFVVAGIFSLPTMRLSGSHIGRKELLFGCVAALAGAIASGVRPWALYRLDGVIVFPVTTISVILLVQLAGILFWRERLGRWTLLASALAVAGILFLTLNF